MASQSGDSKRKLPEEYQLPLYKRMKVVNEEIRCHRCNETYIVKKVCLIKYYNAHARMCVHTHITHVSRSSPRIPKILEP